ncbi:hemerythrin domain-containing protein [Nocardia sp. NPDC006044]|uniref:hemerythrin domain-containing protein n=1 Tax=Nocardia sp. NPDC006044 TaxID=3364306 RepID=UPI0036795459
MDPHRARTLSHELIDTHQRLRSELRRVARALDEYREDEPIGPLRDLRTHCLTFCQALTDHHTSEDETAFPVLAQRFPDLASVLAELSADHHLIADILTRMTTALAELDPGNLAAVRSEIAGLSAIMESHFQWEERRITAALDKLSPSDYTAEAMFSAGP